MRGVSRVACDLDDASVLADDSAANPETESGAVFSLGGEERLEEVRADLIGDACAVVGDDNGGAVGKLLAIGSKARSVGGDSNGDLAARPGGFGSVGDEVRKDLTQFGGEASHRDTWREFKRNGHAKLGEAVVHQKENLLEHLLEIDGDRRFGFAVEAEHGAANLRDTGQFLLGHVHELAGFVRRYTVAHEIKQV